MERTPEVCLITTDWEPQVPVLTIEYDQPSARALGLSRNDVSLSLLTATGGIPIGSFYEGIHKNNIYLKCLDEKGEPIEDLGNAQVFSSLPSLNGLLNEGNHGEAESRHTFERRFGGKHHGKHTAETNQQRD